jgi:uncharacterized protein
LNECVKKRLLRTLPSNSSMKGFKPEIRVLGIDDSPFEKFTKKDCLIIGTVFRGGKFCDGIMTTKARIDGNNATEKLAIMVQKSRFRSQLRVIFLDGIALAGFNIIDVKSLYQKTGIPIIVVIRRSPDIARIKEVLSRIHMKKKALLLDRAGPIQKIGRIYVQAQGIKREDIERVLKITCTHALIPEPLRVAHLIAAGIGLGESHGDA